jgi:serine/threonine protein phosphatase 1
MPPEHRRFFNGLERLVRRGDYVFAHAGIRPGLPLDRQDGRDLLFIREPFLSDSADLGVVVVHGHTVVDEPEVRFNRIGIDTGAYWTGRLTTLVLEEDTQRFLTTGV